ncbi:NitT/TauT family transport system substrate-binding protein [Variovorax sp. Sphag1AA]|nr:ABC transporter substrate-binding protein [Variovorax sp. Sphag1AA]MBB3181635.1 NitT/TauT family transport system substrate-binding protein [Variovorax sp. Sphag1AA]
MHSPLRMHRAVRRIAAVLASTLTFAAASHAQNTEPAKVRYVFAFPVMSVIVANQTSIPRFMGYFEQENVSVQYSLTAAGGTAGAVQLIASRNQDIGSGTVSPILERAAQGNDDLGISFFYNQLRDFHTYLGVSASSPVKSIRELKGLSIGVPSLSSDGVVVARYYAKEAGMDPEKDLKFVAVGVGAQALQALKTGQVAALSTTEALFAQMETMGQQFRMLPVPPGSKNAFGPGIFAKREYIQNNRKTVVGVGRAIAKSTLFMLTNPEAAVRIHWKVYPEQIPQGIPFEQAVKDAVHVVKAQLIGLKIDESDKNQQFGYYRPESWFDFLRIYGMDNRIKDPTRFYTNDLIADINNFDKSQVIEQARNFRLP